MRATASGPSLVLCAALAALAVAACAAPVSADPDAQEARPHHTAQGFRNNYPHPPPGGFWKWKLEQWRTGVPRTPEGGWHFPLDKPDVARLAANRSEPTITWIGHATMLLQLAGVNILTDPQFSPRASPLAFAGPKRIVAPALAIGELPHIDVVLVSHNHYDHLDRASIEALARQPGGPPRFYVPLGLKRWFAQLDIVADELDWWDTREERGLAIHLVPVQHWSARTLWDRNKTLWGGYVIEHPRFRFFFAGDTAYSQDFTDIGRRFGSFDLAALPIGAYEPRWFMAPQHANPEEAVRIQRDLHATQAIAMHWGTFVLTDEPMDEPPKKLAEALDAAAVPRESFWVFRHGETRGLRLRD